MKYKKYSKSKRHPSALAIAKQRQRHLTRLGNQGAKRATPQAKHRRPKHPLGSRLVADKKTVTSPKRKPTGIPRKFRKRVSPGGYLRRTSWSASRSHHIRKKLKPRRVRMYRVPRWRHRRKTYRPR